MGLRQSRPDATTIIVDIVAVDVDTAVIVDIGGVVAIIAGRPQPPPRSRITKTPDNALALLHYGDNRFLSLLIHAPNSL